METPNVDLSSFFSNFECMTDESSNKRPVDVVDLGQTVKKTKIDESSVLLHKIEKLRESRRMMKAEIQELKEQMTLLNQKVDSMSKKKTCNRKNNVMEQLDIIKNILIDMKK